jgi:UDP-N-acetylmuramate dehydrogenase
MNAGAEKKDIAASLKRVEFFRHPRGVFAKDRDELKMGYREFDLADKTVILAGEFELTPDNPVAIRKRLRAFLKRRRQTQPVSLPSAGSVFKNPHGDFAGRLIEDVGLKGFRVGDAQVSEMHANFIVNRGRAKAKQVLELIAVIKDKVKKEKGVKLELEIEVVGKSDD